MEYADGQIRLNILTVAGRRSKKIKDIQKACCTPTSLEAVKNELPSLLQDRAEEVFEKLQKNENVLIDVISYTDKNYRVQVIEANIVEEFTNYWNHNVYKF